MFTSGDRASWLNSIASKIMDGGDNPPSIDRLNIIVPPTIVTKENDGHVTAAAAFGENARNEIKRGWGVIINEMITLLREQGFVGGNDQALTWIKQVDGTWTVAMPDGRQMTVFGQRERRMFRDRSIVGERDEVDGSRIGPPSQFEDGRIHPFELQVIGARGGVTQQKFELHPFALAIPPMTETEREVLRASIERDGVKVPIIIYQKKILDGRNRGYFASVFKRPVHIEEFKGTEEEARRHVAILNLHRRHLQPAQRYLVAYNLFGEQAMKEAAEAHQRAVTGPRQTVVKIPPSNNEDQSGRWNYRAAAMATEAGIIGITPEGMKAIRNVIGAPDTESKISNGKINSVYDAAKKAREEKALPASTQYEGVDAPTVNKRLGRCIGELKRILRDCETPVGTDPVEISARLREIPRLSGEVELALRYRKIIP